jgi:hypothetical protein
LTLVLHSGSFRSRRHRESPRDPVLLRQLPRKRVWGRRRPKLLAGEVSTGTLSGKGYGTRRNCLERAGFSARRVVQFPRTCIAGDASSLAKQLR